MEWNVIITSGLTSGIVTLILNSLIKGSISHHFNKKLKRFETDLNMMSEEKKLDFQRKLHDFGLYSSKRHEIYPMLYKYLIEASYAVRYPLVIKKYAPDKTLDEKSLLLFKDQESYESLLNEGLTNQEMKLSQEAAVSAEKAFDFFRESELFLSEKVAEQGEKIVTNLIKVAREIYLKNHLKFLEDNGTDFELTKIQLRDDSVIRSEIDEISIQISRLKVLMKNELGIGDYE
ncbi:hypothetical protein [Anoxybacteroides rupiense]|uniref:hypothetical protein n=1 Tax=Anoxybacteroides rupiense TaxID=311460 RepID=UPI00366B3F41